MRTVCGHPDGIRSHVLECIAGGCALHVDPSHYSFDVASALSAIRECSLADGRTSQHSAARARAIAAYSCFLAYIVDLVALDVSSVEMSACLAATCCAASRDSGQELPLQFLTENFALVSGQNDAARGDLSEADMQFLHEYLSALR
jgi:hypothetical protein